MIWQGLFCGVKCGTWHRKNVGNARFTHSDKGTQSPFDEFEIATRQFRLSTYHVVVKRNALLISNTASRNGGSTASYHFLMQLIAPYHSIHEKITGSLAGAVGKLMVL